MLARRNCVALLIGCLTILYTHTCSLCCAEPPNIVYILVDDLGYGDLGCYGQQKIRTPRLDSLAEEGMRFTQHYAGSTVCAPSRCCLMTGLHTGHCSVRGNVNVLLSPEETTVAKALKDAGYFTACVGKWGIGHPPPPSDPKENGFDHFFGYLSMWHAHNAFPEFLWRNGEKVLLRNVVKRPRNHYKKGQEKLTGVSENKIDFAGDQFTEETLKLIATEERPFFLFVSYTAPHANNEAEEMGGIGVETPNLSSYADEDWPEAEKAKAAVITHTDQAVGRILDQLDELQLSDNTVVIFSSDNGPHAEGAIDPEFFDSNGKLRGIKRDLYEGGIRVPMIVRWPGRVAAGSLNDHVSAFWDVLPTLTDIAGAPTPQDVDGVSFMPSLVGKDQTKHDYLYWEFHESSSKQAIRRGDWKAVRLSPSADIELYDLSEDIEELHDVSDQFPDMVDTMTGLFKEARSNEQDWPLKNKAEVIPF